MDTWIEQYQKEKQELLDVEHWLEMLGKPYQGGGGGIGNVCRVSCKPTIYFQAYDGDNNYHDCPPSLCSEIETVIKENPKTLLNLAIQKMRDRLKEVAKKANDEHDRLMRDAGLIS